MIQAPAPFSGCYSLGFARLVGRRGDRVLVVSSIFPFGMRAVHRNEAVY